MVDLYLDIIAWFPNNGLIVVEQTFVGEWVILAEGEFSIQQESRNTGGTYARFPNWGATEVNGLNRQNQQITRNNNP